MTSLGTTTSTGARADDQCKPEQVIFRESRKDAAVSELIVSCESVTGKKRSMRTRSVTAQSRPRAMLGRETMAG